MVEGVLKSSREVFCIYSQSVIIRSYNLVDNLEANKKYLAPSPFHLGLNHSMPSTLMAVGFRKTLVIRPKGPLALFTTKTTDALEKQACSMERRELVNWLSDLVSKPGMYTKFIPLTCLGFWSNSGLWQYTVNSTPRFTRRSPISLTRVS